MDPLVMTARITHALRGMQTLSEVGAAKQAPGVARSPAKSSPPPGVALTGNRRDLRDLSLHDYWDSKFRSARGDIRRLEVFLFLAERDLAQAKRRQPAPDPHENREARERRVLDQYEGLSPLEAALAEGCSEGWIRKVRKAGGVDQQTGTLTA